jgi:hypothetical protein
MSTRHLLLVAAGTALTLAGVTCAPVEAPRAPEKTEPVTEPQPPTPAPPPPRTPSENDPLRGRLEAAIKQAQNRDLLTTNGFWTIFHGILGLGPSVNLVHPETRKRVNALDYLAAGGEVRGLRFFRTRDGLDVETRPGSFIGQGHQDQFVAEMVQWGVSPDRKFVVNGQDCTFMDFIRNAKMRASVKETQELEWALLIIGQHYGTDVTWTNALGEQLRFEDLLRKELDKPLEDAACGGTHRLFGLTWVYHLHLRKGGKTTGIWKEIADRTEECKKKARELQNPGGAFSTDCFRGRGNSSDMKLRINTTGHIFEWLSLALTDEELNEPWMRDAANALAMMFLDIEGQTMEGGPLYHAVHGLLIYYSRVYGPEKLGPMAPPVPLLPAKKA